MLDMSSPAESHSEIARRLRQYVLAMTHQGGGAHIGAALSIADIVTVLYYSSLLNVSPATRTDPDRDRFILSKGHGCMALYAALADRGYFPMAELRKFCTPEGILGGHPDCLKVPGIEASTGSLGHGFPVACGVALAGRLSDRSYRVYALIGDGECQEGSIWEAAMFAGNQKLDNLVAILDCNNMQGMGRVDEINPFEPVVAKWQSFGWAVREIDGHDHAQIEKALRAAPFVKSRPSMVVARTVKGKGISYMEGDSSWHYKMPTPDELKTACAELGIRVPISEVLA